MEVHLIHFDSIDSTNTWAKTHASELDPKKLTCITADIMTAGRGRLNRTWISKKGNLHLSLFFCLSSKDEKIPNLAQIATLSVAHLLIEKGLPIQIKWPNDLLLNEKKLGGILVETTPLNALIGITLGIGLNVNTPVESFISLTEVTQSNWNLSLLRDEIIHHFLIHLEKGFSPIDFDAHLAYKGERVSCLIDKEPVEGILIGLTEHGHLKLQLLDGKVVHLASGEINTLRSIESK